MVRFLAIYYYANRNYLFLVAGRVHSIIKNKNLSTQENKSDQ